LNFNASSGFCTLLSAVSILCGIIETRAQVLYDAGLGTYPEGQGWSYAALGAVTKTLTNNSVFMDTSATLSTQAGWSQIIPTSLNRTNGFTLLLSALLDSESHSSTNRAGFSLIVLGDDKRGIELGFWTNSVFAQSDSPLFTHAEEASFSATTSFVNFALTILSTNYILRADGAAILSGPVRDYTAFNGFPNPYRTANFIFFGDDTTSAGASVNIRAVTLILPPTLSMPNSDVISWTGVSNQTYSVQSSTSLTTWTIVGTSFSPTSSYSFTNTSTDSVRFFRVAFP
jgi:hypothetical protein